MTKSGTSLAFMGQLLPLEGIDPTEQRPEREIEPHPHDSGEGVEVRGQSDIRLEEIPLLQDADAMAALHLLQERGYTADDVNAAYINLWRFGDASIGRLDGPYI